MGVVSPEKAIGAKIAEWLSRLRTKEPKHREAAGVSGRCYWVDMGV